MVNSCNGQRACVFRLVHFWRTVEPMSVNPFDCDPLMVYRQLVSQLLGFNQRPLWTVWPSGHSIYVNPCGFDVLTKHLNPFLTLVMLFHRVQTFDEHWQETISNVIQLRGHASPKVRARYFQKLVIIEDMDSRCWFEVNHRHTH